MGIRKKVVEETEGGTRTRIKTLKFKLSKFSVLVVFKSVDPG